MTVSSATDGLGILRDGCSELGVALTAQQQHKLLAFVDLIYVWNRTAGLTTIPRDASVRLHVLDSLAALQAIERGPCVDLGSGAGLPGLVLAIAAPHQEFVLVESNRRRCSFLLEALRLLGVANASVVEGDVDTLGLDRRFPIVISRAFRPPAEFLATASRLVLAEGRVVLLMAAPSDQELTDFARGAGMELDGCFRLTLPGGRESRAIARFRPV